MRHEIKQEHSTVCCIAFQQAIQSIIEESIGKFPNETGGLLVGRWTQRKIIVAHATKPGPKAHHSSHSFKRDGDYSQLMLDELVAESSGDNDYIGEWHSHPFNSEPSIKDLKAMTWISKNKDYAIDTPIMGLCKSIGLNKWSLEFYILDGNELKQVYICTSL